jgi:hypothetical protein
LPVSNPASVFGQTFESLTAHSSFLTNERIAYLFVELDFNSKNLNETYNTTYLKRTKSTLFQIWKNIRPLPQGSPTCRHVLKLNTKVEGLYTLDVAFQELEAKILYCEIYGGYTYKRNFLMTQELNRIETVIRSILQYFSYNFRPTYKQKPDVVEASISIKQNADKLTVEQLQAIAGPNNTVDFSSLALGQDLSETTASEDDMGSIASDDDEIEE